jgi:hypothetical protein
MGQLDESRFEAAIRAGCPVCHATTLEIRSYLDQRLLMMLADPNDAGRWVHDGEKFIDGIYRITCASCAHVVFDHPACPRCHAPDGLARALTERTRLTVPKRCPKCDELELLALAFVPSVTRHVGGEAPKPKPLAEFGDPGHHVVAFACETCDAAVVASSCPLCDAPGPLRPRP